MRRFCHRCNGELTLDPAESTFCPHCGAPQLRVIEENVTAAVPETDAASTGALPPPHPGLLRWSTVVSLASLIAGIATALMAIVFWLPGAFPIALLWTVSGAVIVLGLYQRKHLEADLNAGVGARVGLVYGLLAVSSMAILTAAAGLIARFGLHHMSTVDAQLNTVMHQALEQQLQQMQASGQAASSPVTPDQMRALFNSPEVKAGLSLAMLTFFSFFLVAFSALTGAMGGLLLTRRR